MQKPKSKEHRGNQLSAVAECAPEKGRQGGVCVQEQRHARAQRCDLAQFSWVEYFSLGPVSSAVGSEGGSRQASELPHPLRLLLWRQSLQDRSSLRGARES